MKRPHLAAAMTIALLALGGGGAVLYLSGCKGGSAKTAEAKRYHCPMHPEIVQDRPGDCPICGMKLVPIEEEKAPPATAASTAKGERKILFYRSPMDPKVTSPTPKKDEIGMEYLPVYSDEVEGSAGGPVGLATITITPERQQLLGLKTGKVSQGPLAMTIRTVGRVAYDERRVHHVHTRYEAYVEHISADFTGKFVKKGEELARVYSPDLFATQQEYLLALRASRSLQGSGVAGVSRGGEQLLQAARQRLILWEISPADIEALEKRGEPIRTLPVYSPVSGYVVSRTAYHGMNVMPADSLFDIVDLSSVWVIADVYEYELPRLSLGQTAVMTLSYWPDRSWQGRVTYIYPAVDEKTRTVKVRLEFANADGDLKPEMFADVTIRGRSRNVLRIPDDAVIDTGTRKLVFVSLGEGKLAPREITVGDHAEGTYEVKRGLTDGETVVMAANFLVDSESRIKAALSAFTPTGAAPVAPAASPSQPPARK